MTWRDVFDCKVRYKTVVEAALKAKECGYKFLAFNADIYFISDETGKPELTGITVEMMNER